MFSAPLLVLLYDYVFIGGLAVARPDREAHRDRARGWFYAALFSTWLIVFGIIVATWKESTIDFVSISPLRYALTQPLVILHYLRLAFWPSPLVLSYAWTLEDQWPRIVFPGLAILGMLAVMFRGIRRREWYGYALAWFFLVLAPTSSVAPMRQAIFEHRMYLSLAAVVLMVVIGAEHAIRRVRLALGAARSSPGPSSGRGPAGAGPGTGPRYSRQCAVFGGVLALTLVIVLGCLTRDRNRDYHDVFGIWRDNLAHHPDSHIALNNLGSALHMAGRTPEAMAYFREALRIDPHYADAQHNLVIALREPGRPQDAVTRYREALRLVPGSAELHNNLGNALHAAGRVQESFEHYHEALRIEPGYAQAHYNLGYALQTAGRLQEAIVHYREAVRLDPSVAQMHYYLGNALQVAGKVSEAIPCYHEALRIDPDHAGAREQLRKAREKMGEGEFR